MSACENGGGFTLKSFPSMGTKQPGRLANYTLRMSFKD